MFKGVYKHEKPLQQRLIYPIAGIQISQANIK